MNKKQTNKLKKQIKKELKHRYPGLLDEIYQYSRDEVMASNSYGQVIYTFMLQKEYQAFESAINKRLEPVTFSFELDSDIYLVTFNAETQT
jgi:hypothetical protein